MKYTLSVLLALSIAISQAQVYRIDNSIEVKVNGESLLNPWAGGLNSGQYSTMDVNLDGQDDLVVFDRTCSKINVFLFQNGQYLYDAQSSNKFPEDVSSWMLLRDFNCDGMKDVFTSDPLGIKVFVNESDQNGMRWRLFNSKAPSPSPLLTKGFSDTPINIQLNSSDIPAIDDIDSDGDLDLLIYKFSGVSTIEYHKNLSIERDSNCDSLQFERITQEFGDFQECGCNQFAFNGDDCPPVGGGRTEHQSGKSILTLDMNGDGLKELVVSEEACGLLSMMTNEGDIAAADYNAADPFFPNTENPVSIFIFPAAFNEDVNNDGAKDLIVAPNVPGNINYGVNFKNSSWLYLNTGTNENPNFQLQQKNFLQDQMLDVGENAAPAFYDYDNDGDLDMFVGMMLNEVQAFRSAIALYENTGTKNAPVFELENPDFLNLSLAGIINIKPQFVDVDSDGLVDLAFTATVLQGGGTGLFYFKRELGNFQFNESGQLIFSPLGIEEHVRMADIDQDGFNDLLIGRSTGRLEYYNNDGLDGAFSFTLIDQNFYGLDFSPFRQSLSVEIADADGDGTKDLITGDARGTLTIYNDFLNNLEAPLEGATEIVTFDGQNTSTYNFGSRIKPQVVNIFNESQPAIILGTAQGGIVVLRSTEAVSNPSSDSKLTVYPNPVNQGNTLTIQSSVSTRFSIVDLLGKVILSGATVAPEEDYLLSVNNLKEGMYLLVADDAGETIRFIVTR
ncbi:MAG: FG-GAP-like repeat-containing protein [Fulvivirga sp.]|uniref:FG-GAP-like repeat-containing protein n=1 Tax=Fulvivirga sp. TaxID=1931237 RepID=UPI0032ED2943